MYRNTCPRGFATLQARGIRRRKIAYATRTFRRISLNKLSKLFFGIKRSAAAGREVTDALVIFSTTIISYEAIAELGGLSLLGRVLGTPLETPSFLYFFGIALMMFSIRRIMDQR